MQAATSCSVPIKPKTKGAWLKYLSGYRKRCCERLRKTDLPQLTVAKACEKFIR